MDGPEIQEILEELIIVSVPQVGYTPDIVINMCTALSAGGTELFPKIPGTASVNFKPTYEDKQKLHMDMFSK